LRLWSASSAALHFLPRLCQGQTLDIDLALGEADVSNPASS
jgi:hypothetical protein